MERDVIKKKRPLVCFILKTSLSKGKLTLKGIKKTKMEDSRGEIIFSEGHLVNIFLDLHKLHKLRYKYYFWDK